MSKNPIRMTFIIPDMSWLYDYKAQFPLGILYLAEVLKKKACRPLIFDTNRNPLSKLPDSEIYAFSSVWNTYQSCVKLAGEIKALRPESKIIIGGVHPTLDSANIDAVFDSVFLGEGEETIAQYVDDVRAGSVRRFYEAKTPIDLAELFPDRTILPEEYLRTQSIFTGGAQFAPHGATSILFSRGCPFKCAFCSSPRLSGQRVRLRPIPAIVREIEGIIQNYKIRQFRVQDDTFTLNKSYTLDLCRALRPLQIFYRCSTRVNVLDADLVQALYESGCREIGVGIEVADDEALRKLNKGITVAQAERAIAAARGFPIALRCFFMMGLPFDSPATMRNNIDFIERNKIDNVVVGNFIPFPGSAMHDRMADFNIRAIRPDACMNFGRHLPLRPNIQRLDMSEQEHLKIMEIFYNYLIKKRFL